jgi:hypothetical protein
VFKNDLKNEFYLKPANLPVSFFVKILKKIVYAVMDRTIGG